MANWEELTNDEFKRALTIIALESSTPEEVNKKAKEELEYPYNIAITYDRTGEMFMGMAHSRDGLTISF